MKGHPFCCRAGNRARFFRKVQLEVARHVRALAEDSRLCSCCDSILNPCRNRAGPLRSPTRCRATTTPLVNVGV